MFKARQSKKAASALDGMHQAEDVLKNPGFGILLQLHQFHVKDSQTFGRFGQKFAEKIIHSQLQLPPLPDIEARIPCSGF